MYKKYLLIVFIFQLHVIQSKAQNVLDVLSLNDTAVVQTDATAAAPIMAKKWNQFKTKYFTLNIGVAVFLDYNTATSQSVNNIQQVGKIGGETEFRAQRLVLTGNLLFFKYPWRYMISANYNGMDKGPESPAFAVIDMSMKFLLVKKADG